ncbi:MAG: hypothetical protein KDD64_08730 [Bdellovibrionales bacterium]|nr:hypothetical protein [Bdellovibrionales bacterium]
MKVTTSRTPRFTLRQFSHGRVNANNYRSRLKDLMSVTQTSRVIPSTGERSSGSFLIMVGENGVPEYRRSSFSVW